MSKLYWRALKKLSNKFVHDATQATEVLRGAVIAVNPHHAPIIFVKGRWRPLKLVAPADVKTELAVYGTAAVKL